jgi:hypothetical protein
MSRTQSAPGCQAEFGREVNNARHLTIRHLLLKISPTPPLCTHKLLKQRVVEYANQDLLRKSVSSTEHAIVQDKAAYNLSIY